MLNRVLTLLAVSPLVVSSGCTPSGTGATGARDSGGGESGAPSLDAAPDSDVNADPCSATVMPSNTVVPLLGKPFDGSFDLVNHFDHDVPEEFSDTNGYQISWCGVTRTNEIDGHRGYDWALPVGTPVYAPADGYVDAAGNDISFYCPLLGKTVTDQLVVEIYHTAPNGEHFNSMFKHLSQVDVALGQNVTAGQQLGLSGNSGCSTGPHLHFEVWRHEGTNTGNPTLVDPYGWLGPGTDPWLSDSSGSASVWLWLPGAAPNIFPDY